MAAWNVLWTCLGTIMVAASASVLNQWIERDRDAIMKRTSRRPLPTGRVAASQAAWMGWVLVIAGSLILGLLVNLPTMACGNWQLGSCMWLFTHRSSCGIGRTRLSVLCPVHCQFGWAGQRRMVRWLIPRAWILLGILVAWQLPHFMSIAWLYREQYEFSWLQDDHRNRQEWTRCRVACDPRFTRAVAA